MSKNTKHAALVAFVFLSACLCWGCGGSSPANGPKSAQQKVDEHEQALQERDKQLEETNKQLQADNTRLMQENASIKGERGLSADERDARYKKDREALDQRERDFEAKKETLVANASLAGKLQEDLLRERADHAGDKKALEQERDEAKSAYLVRTDVFLAATLSLLALVAILAAFFHYRAKKSADLLAAARLQADDRSRKFESMQVTLRQGFDIFKGLSPEQLHALPRLSGTLFLR